MASQNIFISANQLPDVLHLKDVLQGVLKSENISRSCSSDFSPHPQKVYYVIQNVTFSYQMATEVEHKEMTEKAYCLRSEKSCAGSDQRYIKTSILCLTVANHVLLGSLQARQNVINAFLLWLS